MLAKPPAERRAVNGILLVDKPSGPSSNRVLQHVRRLYLARKAGHTGTLDPLATGMLPVCFGSATRVSGMMLDASKRYRVRAQFNTATETGDADGRIIDRRETGPPEPRGMEQALAGLRGRIRQVPPMYSAVKHEGRRLYELARRGLDVERPARTVEVWEFALEALEWPQASFIVHCSKGTYVRTLITELASRLGTVGHVASLRRLAVGPFTEDQLVTLEQLEAAAEQGLAALDGLLHGVDAALVDFPALKVSDDEGAALRKGQRIRLEEQPAAASVRIYDGQGRFVGLCQLTESGELKPARIFPA